jgi:hypothetical protein
MTPRKNHLQTIGYRRVISPSSERFRLFQQGVLEEPLRVFSGTRVLVLAARTRRTSRLIRTLRRGNCCYVKYGSSLDHLASALGSFDHYLFGSSLRINNEDLTRKLVLRTSLDLRSLLAIQSGEYIHWSARHRQAAFRPSVPRYIAALLGEAIESTFKSKELA